MNTPVQIKRVYEPQADSDGFRVFIDRLWPRGISKSNFHYDLWCKDLAPSPALRTWFGHKAENWEGFKRDYGAELESAAAQKLIAEVFAKAGNQTISLVFGAKDQQHNHALILAEAMNRFYQKAASAADKPR